MAYCGHRSNQHFLLGKRPVRTYKLPQKKEASVFATPVGSGGAFKLVLMIVTQVAKHHRVEHPGQLLAFEGLAL